MLMPDLSDRAARLGAGRGPGGRGRHRADPRGGRPAPRRPVADRGHARPGLRLADRAAGRAAAAPRDPGPLRDWLATASPSASRFLEGWDGLRPAGVAGRRRARAHVSMPTRAAARRARRAARDGAPRRPQAQQRRAARGWPDRAHRLADDDARARSRSSSAGCSSATRGSCRIGRRPSSTPIDGAVAALEGEAIQVGAPFDARRAYPPGALAAVVGEDEPARFRPADAVLGDWALQVDLAWIVGLLLRGWRKGADAEAGAVIGVGRRGDRRPRLVVRPGGRGRRAPPLAAGRPSQLGAARSRRGKSDAVPRRRRPR